MYNAAIDYRESVMGENEQATTDDSNHDGTVDAVAAVALVIIPVLAIIFWLSGQ